MIQKLKRLPRNYRQFIKFCVVGTISMVVNITTYTICTRYFLIYYVASDVIAYIIALINSYALNRKFTFRSKNKQIGAQFTKYTTVYLVGMGLSAGLLYIFVSKFGLYDMIAKFIVIGIVLIWNFFATKFLIFDRDEKAGR
ncbi:MAG: GtrA family protein [Patescibacteria group bacterium]|nr:GtrA family protein [Patescibacteria group bacterium]